MNWKKWTTIGVVLIFITLNFYLLLKKDSEITKSKYIDEWRTVKEQNLVLSKEKPGIVAPVEEEFVYYQNGVGDFNQFLVNEGEEVQVGTPLFEYTSKPIEGRIEQLEAEISQLEEEQDALEDNINSLERLERNIPVKKDEEATSANEALAATIETQIYEKELQLSRIEAEIEKYEELVSISDAGLQDLTVTSNITGIVKNISYDLVNPVVTISSSELHVEGILEEEEVMEIQDGMKAIISGAFGKKDGIISQVAVQPNEEPDVDKKSQYEFTVMFSEESEEAVESEVENEEDGITVEQDSEDENEEDGISIEPESPIISGAHVNIKIVTQEVENALTLPAKTIRNNHIYVLQGNGKIEKRSVETGIEINDIREIISSVEEGELVVNEPNNIRNNTTFFTPIEISKMKKKDFKDLGKKEILLLVGRGFLSR